MIAHFAQCAKSIMAGWANAHGCVGLHHHRSATGLTGTVHNVGHEVQTGLQQQTVIAGKKLLIHQLFHLDGKCMMKTLHICNVYIRTALPYLQWCGQGRTLVLRTVKALNVAITYLDLEILGQAGLTVHMLALFKAEAAIALLLHEADPTTEDLAVKHLLPLRLVKVQELR